MSAEPSRPVRGALTVGPTSFQLVTGEWFDVSAPDPALITAEVVAHALSGIARYGGHLPGDTPYTVAHHSILVAELCTKDSFAGLLHDASEALGLGDIITPAKRAIGRDEIRAVEARLDSAVGDAFGIDPSRLHSAVVKRADRRALVIEMLLLRGPDFMGWAEGFEVAAAERWLAANVWFALVATEGRATIRPRHRGYRHLREGLMQILRFIGRDGRIGCVPADRIRAVVWDGHAATVYYRDGEELAVFRPSVDDPTSTSDEWANVAELVNAGFGPGGLAMTPQFYALAWRDAGANLARSEPNLEFDVRSLGRLLVEGLRAPLDKLRPYLESEAKESFASAIAGALPTAAGGERDE